jgi:hypothetical protein
MRRTRDGNLKIAAGEPGRFRVLQANQDESVVLRK